jgi:hypothetical protein
MISSVTGANDAESSRDLSVVDVPQTMCSLTEQEFFELQQQINPLAPKEMYNTHFAVCEAYHHRSATVNIWVTLLFVIHN